GFMGRAAVGITLPSVLLHFANRDEEGYAEIPQWQRDLFWLVKMGDHWIRIPKPFELGMVFGSIPERLLEFADTHDPKGVTESLKVIAGDIGQMVTPIPTAVMPL